MSDGHVWSNILQNLIETDGARHHVVSQHSFAVLAIDRIFTGLSRKKKPGLIKTSLSLTQISSHVTDSVSRRAVVVELLF